MKNKLSKEKTNSLYKNAFFVSIIAISIFNLSNANAQEMMRRGEKENIERKEGRMMMNNNIEKGKKDIIGTVTAINGNTITISSVAKGEGKNSASTTKIFTVDATNAKIVKSGATSSIASIVIGNKISVVGSVSGNTIAAKIIRADISNMMGEKREEMMGDGKPVIQGKITSINGNTLTITNKSNVAYTVDVTNSKIFIDNATATISSLGVNNEVVVQGTVNGTNISATSVITHKDDHKDGKEEGKDKEKGFFEKTKGFFKRMFGF